MEKNTKSGELPMPETNGEKKESQASASKEDVSVLTTTTDEDTSVSGSGISASTWTASALILCMLVGGSAYLLVSVPRHTTSTSSYSLKPLAPPTLPPPPESLSAQDAHSTSANNSAFMTAAPAIMQTNATSSPHE